MHTPIFEHKFNLQIEARARLNARGYSIYMHKQNVVIKCLLESKQFVSWLNFKYSPYGKLLGETPCIVLLDYVTFIHLEL